MEERITSRKNSYLQQVRKLLSSRKEREKEGLFVADGTKLLQEAVKYFPGLDTVILSDGIVAEVPAHVRVIRVPEDVMASISPMQTPQGALFVCRLPQKTAFLSYYSMKEYGLKYIGLDESLKVDYNDRIELCSGIRTLCEGVTLFTCRDKNFPQPECNSLLYGPDKKTNDDFSHEQSLLIEESENVVLIAGCAHSGILNIMQVAEHLIDRKITHVVSGFHLMQSCDCKELESLSELLATHKGCKYYTMHCTGKTQYETLCQYMKNNILYLSCGDTIEID